MPLLPHQSPSQAGQGPPAHTPRQTLLAFTNVIRFHLGLVGAHVDLDSGPVLILAVSTTLTRRPPYRRLTRIFRCGLTSHTSKGALIQPRQLGHCSHPGGPDTKRTFDGGVKEMTRRTGWHGYNHSPAEARSDVVPTSRLPMERFEEPTQPSDDARGYHQPRRARRSHATGLLPLLLLTVMLLVDHTSAAFINFQNCLDPSIVNSQFPQQQLQFVPLFVWATFKTSSKSYDLNLTAYGNIAGIATQQPYPPPDDRQWANPNETVGKIPDVAGPQGLENFTTFETSFRVLDYAPYKPEATRFCNSSSLTPCPLAPIFNLTVDE